MALIPVMPISVSANLLTKSRLAATSRMDFTCKKYISWKKYLLSGIQLNRKTADVDGSNLSNSRIGFKAANMLRMIN